MIVLPFVSADRRLPVFHFPNIPLFPATCFFLMRRTMTEQPKYDIIKIIRFPFNEWGKCGGRTEDEYHDFENEQFTAETTIHKRKCATTQRQSEVA
jgi:hypothetical protein